MITFIIVIALFILIIGLISEFDITMMVTLGLSLGPIVGILITAVISVTWLPGINSDTLVEKITYNLEEENDNVKIVELNKLQKIIVFKRGEKLITKGINDFNSFIKNKDGIMYFIQETYVRENDSPLVFSMREISYKEYIVLE